MSGQPENERMNRRAVKRLHVRGATRWRFLFGATTAAVFAAVPVNALGSFAAPGQGTGAASAGTLEAPSISSAIPGAGTVDLSWSAVPPPSGTGAVSYYVTRDGGAPTGCPTSTSPTTATSCKDTGLLAGPHSYAVTAVWH